MSTKQNPSSSSPDPHGQWITHPNGQTSFYILDDFTDPWRSHQTETILIQHGFARHSAFWYHWIPVLARKYRVIRRDLRGHGWSSFPDDNDPSYTYNLPTILDEIINFLDQLGIEKVHFLGESTSGMLGEALAALYPSRLHSLIICSAPTYLPQAALDLFAFGHSSWPEACRVLGSRGWGEALRKVPGTSVGPPSGHYDAGNDDDVDGDSQGYQSWWLDQVAISPSSGLAGYATFLSTLDARPYIRQIDTTRVPVLILCPANSAAVKIENQRSDVLDVLIKNNADKNEESKAEGFCKMVVINGRGHEIYVERPGECQHEVLAFLDEVASRRMKLQQQSKKKEE